MQELPPTACTIQNGSAVLETVGLGPSLLSFFRWSSPSWTSCIASSIKSIAELSLSCCTDVLLVPGFSIFVNFGTSLYQPEKCLSLRPRLYSFNLAANWSIPPHGFPPLTKVLRGVLLNVNLNDVPPILASFFQDIVNSEMAYMGFHDSESYGLTWKVSTVRLLFFRPSPLQYMSARMACGLHAMWH